MEKMKPITKTQHMENAVETLESQKRRIEFFYGFIRSRYNGSKRNDENS